MTITDNIQNGRADQAFAMTQHYNESSQQSDLYVRMEAFRYDSSSQGWAALAIGQQMKGALMFIMYGDPSAPGSPLTLTARTVDGHHPPRPIAEMKDFYDGFVPDIDVSYTHFDEYTGQFFHEKMQKKPSHLGIAEFIVRGYDKWTACPVDNSTNQEFVWSSNFKQDFQGDFTQDRHIDMHQFGLGFGFVWVDLLNAVTPSPMFGPINDLEGHKGVNEIDNPSEPTQEELAAGAAYIASHSDGKPDATPGIINDIATNTAAPTTDATAAAEPAPSTSLNPNPDVEQPVKSPKQDSLRDWMWHLHGLLMVLAFIIFYPLGVYFIRSSKSTAFNLHWGVQALGSISVLVGAIIGYWQSHSISIAHQYFGILIFVGVAAQLVLGWRHHVEFLRVKTPTWMSRVHVWLGRAVLPAGMLNVFFGLKLREYGWLTILLSVLVMIVELGGLFVYVRHSKKRGNVRIGGGDAGKRGAEMTGAEAEEYFQLTADDDDDDDGFSDSDVEDRAGDARKTKERENAERLRRLDKV